MGNIVVFVHGTGVREEGYESSYKLVKKQVDSLLGLPVAPCYWGTKAGAKLLGKGVSIPKYAETGGGEPSEDEQELIRWTLLYADPWYELRLIGDSKFEKEDFIPGQKIPSEALDETIRAYKKSEDLDALLLRANYTNYWNIVRKALLDSAEYERAIESVGEDNSNHLHVLSRAHIAQLVMIASDNNMPMIDGKLRDDLVEQLGTDLKAYKRGLGAWLSKPFLGLAMNKAKKWGTNKLLEERGKTSDMALAVPTDIILYQTRGKPIRDYIAQAIADAPGDSVTVVAHSLGGIAAVDLLIANHIEKVSTLVTVGSQAPLMYELNCLNSLEYGKPLPEHFPRWLNIYDRRDALSYVGAELFPERVVDVEVNNKQPFPEAHSAYWANAKVWEAISEF